MTPTQMAAKFHDARDLIRRLHPVDWRAKLAPATNGLRQVMQIHSEDCVHACLRIGRVAMANGEMDQMTWYLAAAAEIVEPTP